MPKRVFKKKKPKQFINRELSWLNFNERVLLEASDPSTPLIERLVFLGIFSSNLDEFFRVRVAVYRRLINLRGSSEDIDTDFEPAKVLRAVRRRIKTLRAHFDRLFEQIKEELASEKIYLIDETQLTPEQGDFVRNYFRDSVRQHLFPIMLDRFKNFSNLHDNSIYLLVDLTYQNQPTADNLALIEIPTKHVPRFLVLPSAPEEGQFVIFLDDVIRYCFADIFSVFGFTQFKAYTIKFTRDAELDIDNDVQKSFLEMMRHSIKRRKFGDTVRFIYDQELPRNILVTILKKFGVQKRDSIEKSGEYHNMKDLIHFPRTLGLPRLQYQRMPQLEVPVFKSNRSMLDVIRERDVLLHYPYQPFQYIIDLVREASIDPAVRAIKMTIYRAAANSAVINALINAARNGKEVTVLIEFQARFDEEANISWADRMQEEGIRLLQNIPGMKVHAKLLLIRRKENGENVYYGAVGTGNPNEITTRYYTDEHLLTADVGITKEINKLFHLLDDQRYQLPIFKNIVVSPFKTRNFFLRRIEKEIENAKRGKPAWLLFKLNNLVDKRIVSKLYEASQAGVRVDLIVRGICTLIPGIAKVSNHIRAIRIVDRFLEHSRIYVFGNGGKPEYYIGSADLMERNLDHRIEVTVPIKDPEIQEEIWKILQIQLSDNVKARVISRDRPNELPNRTKSKEKIEAQREIYRYLKELSEKKEEQKIEPKEEGKEEPKEEKGETEVVLPNTPSLIFDGDQ